MLSIKQLLENAVPQLTRTCFQCSAFCVFTALHSQGSWVEVYGTASESLFGLIQIALTK